MSLPDLPEDFHATERQRVIEELKRHCADGALTLDDLSDRVGDALEARSRAELEKVTADLPVLAAPPAQRPARRAVTWVVGILGAGTRKGRWRPGEQTRAVAFLGSSCVDLRNASIEGEEVEIVAVSFMGEVEVIVPEGVEVELSGVAIMGSKEMRVRKVPPLPGTPIVRVRAFSFWGSVKVRNPKRRAERPHEIAQSGTDEVPDRALAAGEQGPEGTVTVVFTDIAGFTVLCERLGDDVAQEILRSHNRLVRESVSDCGGRVVKAQGDGFMLAFDSARRAVRCAVAMQRGFAAWSRENPDRAFAVRMGVHTGEAIREDDDLYGRAVIVASRITGAASPGEVLLSSVTGDVVSGTPEITLGECRTVELKGVAQPQQVRPVSW